MDDRDRDADGRFVAGNRIGRAGRPPNEAALTPLLRTCLEEKVTLPSGQELTRGQVVVARLVAMAMAGDLPAIRLILERIDGRVVWADEGPEETSPRVIRVPFGFPKERPAGGSGTEPYTSGGGPSSPSDAAPGGDGDAEKRA